MEKKDNKTLYIGIAVAAVVVIAIVVAIVVGKGKAPDNNGGNSGNNGNTSQTETGMKASELANVDIEVKYGDYDAMYDLSKAIQNGEMTGKVVKIDGTVSHPGSLYSVVQRNEANTQSIGTQFVIEGETGYPKDKAHVVITGKVVEKEPLYFVIKTLPEFIETKED